ncbi:MAG: BlaI/MecI/CopY family transcriptional regulator [Clostridia bacterium]|nr:BlaI/MecI/CopY family transcriptional regulator [Clostridia bacterium]
MENKRLAESDFRFMSIIWESEPVGSTELARLCLSRLGWKKSTTYTMIKKMCEKGLAKNENAVVTSLVTKGEVQASESELFVEQTFSGSLPGFLVSFLGGKKISNKEAAELKRLIDEYRED